MCLSDNALDSVTKEDHCKPIITEAYSNALNHQWSSFICLLALSSVVKLPIESYFPITPSEENIDSLSTMFNCTIYPREIAASISNEKIHIYRCALMPMDYPRLGKVPATKNHYVPLCEPKDSSNLVGIQHFVLKQVSPGINVSSTEVIKNTPPIEQIPTSPSSTSFPGNSPAPSQKWDLVPCKKGLTDDAVATTIKEFLHDLNLPIDDCRGQGYDGAGNMAGRLSGVAAKIQETNEKALYVYCNSHRLNLCVAACCKDQLVRNMMEHVRVATEFFNISPKRFELLVKTIEELLPSANHKRLINVCETRWVARVDGLSVFIEVFPAIVRCFEIIRDKVSDKWNPESIRKAGPLYLATVSFSFIVALVVVSRCLQVTRPLTVQLQESALDAGAAREKVTGLYVHLEKMRKDVDARHESWYEEAESIGNSVGSIPDQPRTIGRQQHRANTQSDSPSQLLPESN